MLQPKGQLVACVRQPTFTAGGQDIANRPINPAYLVTFYKDQVKNAKCQFLIVFEEFKLNGKNPKTYWHFDDPILRDETYDSLVRITCVG